MAPSGHHVISKRPADWAERTIRTTLHNKSSYRRQFVTMIKRVRGFSKPFLSSALTLPYWIYYIKHQILFIFLIISKNRWYKYLITLLVSDKYLLSYIVNTMAVDALVTKGARASAAMVLT